MRHLITRGPGNRERSSYRVVFITSVGLAAAKPSMWHLLIGGERESTDTPLEWSLSLREA